MRTRTGLGGITLTLFLLLATALPGEGPVAPAELGQRLLEAAQHGEVAEVRRLLAAGADVDSRSPYGATALFFAADKGNLELAELLLAHGAEVNVSDDFYRASPLTWALFKAGRSPQHREVVLRLLAAGADDAATALSFGVRLGDLGLVTAAVESGKAGGQALRSALAQARDGDQEAVIAYLAAHQPESEQAQAPTVELTAEQMAGYSGDYKNDQTGMRIKIFAEEGKLKAQPTGQSALTLDPTGEGEFVAREAPEIAVTFSGRGGLTERFVLSQGGRDYLFTRSETETPARETKTAAGGTGAARTELAAPLKIVRDEPRPWPSFRGPGGSGIGDGQGVPEVWDAEDGENIRWKTPIPGLALSSPVVWSDRIFVSTAVSSASDKTFRTGLYGDVDSVEEDAVHSFELYALDKATGRILWRREASRGRPRVKRHMKSSHANPTPVTDGRHVVVSFGSQGLFCFDLDGELLWKRDLGVLSSGWFYDPTYEWGFGSSPILHRGRVIVQADVQEGSFLAAFDVETGEERWRTARDEIPSWGTPAVLPGAGEGHDEIVTNARTVRGYDAATGRELWRLGPNSEITVASPVVAGGMAYVTGGYPPVRPIYAVKPGGRGDLTLPAGQTASEHVPWSRSRGGTYIPTPLVYRGVLYVLHNNGRLTAHEAASGEEIYRARVGHAESFSASPVAADGNIFFTTEEGRTYVVRAGGSYEELRSNELGEVVMATPAISDGLLVIRGVEHVYGIAVPPADDGEEE